MNIFEFRNLLKTEDKKDKRKSFFRKLIKSVETGANAESQGATGLRADGVTSDRGGLISISSENFIQVPSLCKFTFMKGNAPHGWLTQFKACAISNVVVNYTPDNTYATYNDGSPVATEIRLSFQETKLIFRGDVDTGF